MKSRTLVIGDIHGCYKKLDNMLKETGYNPETDQLILLGDYIDRGSKSYEVVQKVKQLIRKGAIALKGNHELLAINAIEDENNKILWIYNGGNTTIESYMKHGKLVDDDVKFFKSLPDWYEDDNYIYVHAGLDPQEPLPELTPQSVLLWIRNEWLYDDTYSGKPVVFGHTPMDDVQIYCNGKKIAVDTGAVFGNGRKLSCIELPSMKIYQV